MHFRDLDDLHKEGLSVRKPWFRILQGHHTQGKTLNEFSQQTLAPHLILLDFGAIGSCVENFVVFKLRQSLKAEYHDGEEDDEHGDDGDDAGVLAGLGILEQQPHPPLEIIGWKWFLLLFDKTFIFPANKKDKQYTIWIDLLWVYLNLFIALSPNS